MPIVLNGILESATNEVCVIIRPALPEDWETIAHYNVRLADETEGKTLDPATIQAGVKALLADQRHGRYFVACLDQRIIGQMMHTREWSDWRNGEIWWLQSIYVHPDHRQRGVFRTMYRHLEKLAEETSGVVGFRLYVEHQNLRAQQVYRALGLSEAGYSVLERMFGKLLD